LGIAYCLVTFLNVSFPLHVCQAGREPAQGTKPMSVCFQVVRNVQNILQTNCSVASSLGPPFLSQMSLIYVDMLSVYKCEVDAHLLASVSVLCMH
jgi:hypothetical protein